MALLALFILAVMRWNINFSRNGFPTIEVPFYTFGTLAFLLYGLRNPQKPLFYKNWPFYAAAVFFAMGLYTYQAYKVVPLLILLFAVYEAVTNRKAIVSNWKPILLFIGLFLVLAYPYLKHTYDLRGLGGRENDLSILGRVHTEHSYAPLIYNITRTALMFHWKGDPMARHNLQDYRMLDDATGILFFLGVMFSLAFAARKPSFYGLTGFLVMTVPCVLSIDPAHANRMLGTTPFIALLAAQPLAALWERVRSAGWQSLHRLFLAILGVVFALMTLQN
jgi:hypothetical protein